MRAEVLSLLLVAACGETELGGFQHLNGAPISNRGMGFDPTGRAVVAGLAADGYVLTREGDWAKYYLDRHTPSSTGASFVRTDAALFATLQTQLYKLDDVDAFTWSPIGPDYGRIVGSDAAGRLYAVGGNMIDLRRWSEGDAEWTPVANLNAVLGGLTVLPEGTVFFDDYLGGHVYRAAAGEGAQVFAECATTEGCEYGLGVWGSDRENNVYFLECPQIYEGRDHRYVWKSAHGTEPPKHRARLPDAYPYCISLTALDDGTLFLITATDNLTTGTWAFFTLAPGDDTFSQITEDGSVDWGYNYVVRDASTVYGWGDGEAQGGIVKASR